MGNIVGRLLGLVFTTFLIAALYGLFIATADFMNAGFDPVKSAHRADAGVYHLFGDVSEEIERNDVNATPKTVSTAHRIAKPYAVTADVSALLGGKLELLASSAFHGTLAAADKVAPPAGKTAPTSPR